MATTSMREYEVELIIRRVTTTVTPAYANAKPDEVKIKGTMLANVKFVDGDLEHLAAITQTVLITTADNEKEKRNG